MTTVHHFCEGVYAKQVAGTTLFLASFTGSFEDYDLGSQDSLTLTWSKAADSGVQIRAETIRGGRYYRMDTLRPPEDSSYRWPSRVLSAEQIRRRDLGVVGWTRMRIADSARVVFVPLEVRQSRSPSCGGYDLVLVPGERLTEVYLSLAFLGADGTPVEFIKRDQPLGRGFYPAENPIPVQIKSSEVPKPGLYYLKTAARLSNGATATKEYVLFIASSAACPT